MTVTCTGFVISQKHMMTSAHCFWNSVEEKMDERSHLEYTIWYGKECLDGIANKCPKDAHEVTKHEIRSIYYPKYFHINITSFDFAIIEIKDRFDLSQSF
jgi:hypothetical protein